VIGDPPLLAELRPNSLGKAEVGRMVAVHVAEFASPDGERKLTTSAGPAWTPGHEVTSAVMRWLALG
jgi:hypothetical protein